MTFTGYCPVQGYEERDGRGIYFRDYYRRVGVPDARRWDRVFQGGES